MQFMGQEFARAVQEEGEDGEFVELLLNSIELIPM
jgi:hypothetical protein